MRVNLSSSFPFPPFFFTLSLTNDRFDRIGRRVEAIKKIFFLWGGFLFLGRAPGSRIAPRAAAMNLPFPPPPPSWFTSKNRTRPFLFFLSPLLYLSTATPAGDKRERSLKKKLAPPFSPPPPPPPLSLYGIGSILFQMRRQKI